MLLAIDPGTPFEYVPLSERGETDPTTFTFRPMTSVDRVELSTLTSPEESMASRGAVYAVELVRRCLIGWTLRTKNPKAGEDGQPATFAVPLERDFGLVRRTSLSRVSSTVLYELAAELARREAIETADVGKS